MIMTVLLDEKIKQSGKKMKYLAEKCGLSMQGFRNCRNNKAEFKTGHIKILCAELGITKLTEKEAIFYADNVA